MQMQHSNCTGTLKNCEGQDEVFQKERKVPQIKATVF